MRLAIIALSLALAGCVTTDTAMLDSRTAIISARGNAFANAGDVQRDVLQEAATQAVARGYTHFVVLGASDKSRTGTYTAPTQTNSTVQGAANCNAGFCFGSASGQTTTTGGQQTTFIKPGADVTVQFLHSNEAVNIRGAWKASDILAVAEE